MLKSIGLRRYCHAFHCPDCPSSMLGSFVLPFHPIKSKMQHGTYRANWFDLVIPPIYDVLALFVAYGAPSQKMLSDWMEKYGAPPRTSLGISTPMRTRGLARTGEFVSDESAYSLCDTDVLTLILPYPTSYLTLISPISAASFCVMLTCPLCSISNLLRSGGQNRE